MHALIKTQCRKTAAPSLTALRRKQMTCNTAIAGHAHTKCRCMHLSISELDAWHQYLVYGQTTEQRNNKPNKETQCDGWHHSYLVPVLVVVFVFPGPVFCGLCFTAWLCDCGCLLPSVKTAVISFNYYYMI